MENFDRQKRAFFVKTGLSVRPVMRLHKYVGNLRKGTESWRNVSEHCLVEVARVDVLAAVLRLSGGIRGKLRIAAALHDVGKREEVAAFRAANETENSAWEACTEASRQSAEIMKRAGFSDDVIALASIAGDHNSFAATLALAEQDVLTDEETARLIMSYVDDMSAGSTWATPAVPLPDGSLQNTVDRRLEAGEKDPRYARMNEEAREHFAGRTMYAMQRETAHAVEQRLAALLSEKTGEMIDPKRLPEWIDLRIRERIAAEQV